MPVAVNTLYHDTEDAQVLPGLLDIPGWKIQSDPNIIPTGIETNRDVLLDNLNTP